MGTLANTCGKQRDNTQAFPERHLETARIAIALACMVLALCAGVSNTAWGAVHKADPRTATKTVRIVTDDLSNRWDYDGSGITTRFRWQEKQDEGNLVYCINPGVKHGPPEGTVSLPARLLSESDFKNKGLYRACMAALYYAPGGPGYKTDDGSAFGRNLFPDTDWRAGPFGYKDRFGCAHCLMGFYYNNTNWDDTYPQSDKQPASAFRSWFYKYMLPAKYGGTGSGSYGELALEHYNDKDMRAHGGYTVEAWEDSVYLLMTGDVEKQDLLTYIDIPRGPLRIQKTSATASVSQDNPCYSLKGAVYTVYSDAECTDVSGTITTDDKGAGTLEGLVSGTYYVKETKSAPGFLPDTTTHKVKVAGDKGGSFTSQEPPRHLPIDVLAAKVDADTGKNTPQGAASLAGARFTVCFYAGYHETESALPASPTSTWDNLTTGDDGRLLKAIDRPLGTYTVKETAAPRGYRANEKLFIGQVVADDSAKNGARLKPINYASDDAVAGYNTPIVAEKCKAFGFRFPKIDGLMEGPQPEGDTSLSEAVYSVVNESENPVRINGVDYEKGQVCLTVRTEQIGGNYLAQTAGATLPFGNYTICEQEPPVGYLPNKEWRLSLTSDDTLPDGHIFDFSESACADFPICGGIEVPKIDREARQFLPLGEATLEGAEFTIYLASEQPVKVDGSVFRTGDAVKTICVGTDGKARTGERDLPYGTYLVRETKAPTGYLLNTDWEARVEVRDHERVYATDAADDQVKRGDVRLNKVHGESMSRMGRIAFLATSKTTGERHVLVCDENGSLDTSAGWIPHTQQTNANDQALLTAATPNADATGAVCGHGTDTNDPSSSASTETESSEPSSDADTDNQEPAGTDEGNASADDAEQGEAITPTASPSEGESAAEAEEGAPEGDHPDFTAEETVSEPSSEQAQRTRLNLESLAHAMAKALGADTLTISECEHLSKLLESAPPETDVGFTAAVKTGDKTEQRGFIATVEEDGSLCIRDAETDDEVFFLDAAENTGESGTASPGNDEGSQPHSSSSSQTNSDNEDVSSGSSIEEGSSSENTPDSPATGLENDDQAGTGLDIDNERLNTEAGAWFSGRTDTTTEPNDSLGALPYDTYTFEELRSSANAGMSLVKFEVVVHRDSQNLDMGTIDNSPISLCTELTSPMGTHLAPSTGSVTLTDSVSYTGLSVGKDYRLRGYLVDKESGETVGEASSVTFEPEDPNGKIDVPLEIDTTSQAGKALVAYQELYEGDALVAEHKSLDDTDETIFIPSIATTLTASSGEKELQAAENTQLLDRVDYEGLLPGTEYTLKATLHVKDANGSDSGILKDADGHDVCAEISFTPDTSHGSVSVPLPFNATQFSGHAVAFEELWLNETIYAEHKDITDADQTIELTRTKTKEPKQPSEPPTPEEQTPTSSTPPTSTKTGKLFEKTGNVLAEYWWLLILVACLGAGSATYAAYSRRPQYTSWS